MRDIEIRIHWLSITVFTDLSHIGQFWDKYLASSLGMVEDTGHGAKGFRHMLEGLAGSKISFDPINISTSRNYVQILLPGKACDSLDPETIRLIILELTKHYEINVTRLDVAFDYLSFEPDDFYQAISVGNVRSLAKRESIEYLDSPYMPQESGNKIGCLTVNFGSRSSTRSLRVYNKRGYTRLEVEYRKKRADAISKEVLIQLPEYWPELMIGHLLDFVDLVEDGNGDRIKFWDKFIQGKKRAGLKISNARIVDLHKTLKWIDHQVSPGLSVISDVLGEGTIDEIIKEGRRKRGKRYISLLDTDISDEGGFNVGES